MAIANEMKKDVEDLRFNADGVDASPKLPSVFVKDILVERVNAHRKWPWGWTGLQHDLNEKSRRSQSA
jgi:hypothetical protein